jgi:hypothetical protein
MKLNIIIEKGKTEFWGRIEGSEFLVTCGENLSEITENLKMLVVDYVENEGKLDKKFKKFSETSVEFSYLYDVQTFFASFNYFNISALASQANINQSLLRQYAKGIKFPSIEQAKKIEKTIHQLASKMQRISLTA